MVYQVARMHGWESDLLSAMQKITQGMTGGGSALNRRVLDNLHARYISLVSSGWPLPRYDTALGDTAAASMMRKLTEDTGLSVGISRAFLVSLYAGAKSGKIPEEKYDPVGAKARKEARAAVDPSVWQKTTGAIGKLAGGTMLILVIAAVGAGMYFLRGRKG